MYTVIVADDEEEIRKGIIRKVNWEQVGFQVIGEAGNGADALELVEKLEPDLILTDIRMPFLSGIDLARQIREVRPMIQIAFLSGFDEFSYAQQAIQYNIVSYMLKPISSKELEEELLKIKNIMDEKFAVFTKQSLAQKEIEKSEFLMPLLLDSFLQGRIEEREMRVHAVQTGLLRSVDSDNLKYVVIAAGIVDADGNDRTTPDHVDAIDMILQKYVRCTSCYMKGRIVSVLASTQAGFNKYLHILVEEIVQSVERIMSMKCQIGVSRSMDFLTDCREGYLEAMNAMSYSYSQKGQSHVYFIADEEKNVYFSQENLQLVVEKIEALLRGGTDRELEEYLNELEREVRVGKNSLVLFSLLISMIVASVYKVLYTVAEESDIRRIQSEYPLHEMNEIERIAESFQNVKKMCMLTKAMIAEQRKKSSEVICEKAVQIIEKRYTEQELSVMQVSAEIGVSPNYLSALIKKNTGNTFIELLTKKRIDKARELLCCTSMKIREITEECGYRDQYYFSHCFKKVTGMTPNGCRREYGEQG